MLAVHVAAVFCCDLVHTGKAETLGGGVFGGKVGLSGFLYISSGGIKDSICICFGTSERTADLLWG